MTATVLIGGNLTPLTEQHITNKNLGAFGRVLFRPSLFNHPDEFEQRKTCRVIHAMFFGARFAEVNLCGLTLHEVGQMNGGIFSTEFAVHGNSQTPVALLSTKHRRSSTNQRLV